MLSTGIINVFSRFMPNNVLVPSRNIFMSTPLYLNVTNVLYGEPLKKKKKIDPMLKKAQEERKRRRIEKFIKKLEKTARQLKPISELEVSTKLMQELEYRKREKPVLSADKLEERAQLFKEWTRYKAKEHRETIQTIDQLIMAQDKALEQLKATSQELYEAAIRIDPELLPYSAKGPVHTPAIKNFDSPDGEHLDITKKYYGEENQAKEKLI